MGMQKYNGQGLFQGYTYLPFHFFQTLCIINDAEGKGIDRGIYKSN
jgi:hypothetical protein